MKEIIYLDTELMNSMLAQLDEGLINSFSLEQWDQQIDTEGKQTSRGKSAGVSGSLQTGSGSFFPGINLGIGANLGNNGNETNIASRSILDSQKDILNKAFHDYALDLLIKKLEENNLLLEGESFKEGDLYLGKAQFRFYDFELLKKSVDYSAFQEIMLFEIKQLGMSYDEAKKIIHKPKPTAKERELMETATKVYNAYHATTPVVNILKALNTLSTFASSLVENLTVIKAGKSIGLLKKEYLRESAEALSFRTDKSRKVNLLVRVIGEKKTVYNGSNLPEITESDLDVIPNVMLDIVLGSFDIIKKGDLIVTPIAIFYE